MLRGLSSYYYKEPTLLFLVRVAQGLVHMGKGLLNLVPKHSNSNLISGERARPDLAAVARSGACTPLYPQRRSMNAQS